MWPATATTDGHLHVAADSSIDLQSVKCSACSRCKQVALVLHQCSRGAEKLFRAISASCNLQQHIGARSMACTACRRRSHSSPRSMWVWLQLCHRRRCGVQRTGTLCRWAASTQWRHLELHGLGAETPSAFSSHCMNTLARGTHCTRVCLCTVSPAPVTLMLDWQRCSLLRVGKVYYTSSLIGCDVTSNTVRHCC